MDESPKYCFAELLVVMSLDDVVFPHNPHWKRVDEAHSRVAHLTQNQEPIVFPSNEPDVGFRETEFVF